VWQGWANLASNLCAKSHIFKQKDLNLYAKSRITSHIIPQITNHFSANLKSKKITFEIRFEILEVPLDENTWQQILQTTT